MLPHIYLPFMLYIFIYEYFADMLIISDFSNFPTLFLIIMRYMAKVCEQKLKRE